MGIRASAAPFLVMGVDLAGSPRRATGICFLRENKVSTQIAYKDEEILSLIREKKPVLVAVDAPLSLPPGRRSIEEKNKCHFRACDEELRRRRIPFFPITLGPMRSLTARGIKLKKKIEALGIKVIEVYPGGAQDIWGMPRARRNLDALRRQLQKKGLKGIKIEATADELDAVTAALVGYYFCLGKAEAIGRLEEGTIILPRPGRKR